MHLSAIDLNLLVVFDALYSERSVTRAAARIGLSQSATSHALRRLRDLLDDPLFVRSPGGMNPTPRAELLAEPVARALRLVDGALLGVRPFNPATEKRRFRISATDYVEILLLPDLVDAVARAAPGIDLQLQLQPTGLPVDDLRNGELDLVLGVFRDPDPPMLYETLFRDAFCVIARRDHPTIRGALDLDAYLAQDHLLIAPYGRSGGVVDTILTERGLARRVSVFTPNFSSAPVVVARSNLVSTISRRVAARFAQHVDLQILEPPLELPTWGMRLVWHPRTDVSPAHTWLRHVIREVCTDW